MRIGLLAVFCLVVAEPFSAQERSLSATAEATKTSTDSSAIYSIVEQMPEFGNGQDALGKYMAETISMKNIPDSVKSKVFVKFIVTSTGKVDQVQVLKSIPPCKPCEMEAQRVVTSMPAWRPGMMKGKAVNVYYNLPVVFNKQ